MEPSRDFSPPPPQVIRLKSYTLNAAVPELICNETGQTFPIDQLDIPQPSLNHTSSLPMNFGKPTTMRSAMPMLSTKIRPQELPEFRLKHANIETTSTFEDSESNGEVSSPNKSEGGHGTRVMMDHGPPRDIINPFAQEHMAAAQVVLGLMELRDKYIFEHCQYSKIDELIEEKPETQEPMINYLKVDKMLPALEEAYYKTENGVMIPYIGEKALYVPITMDKYIDDLTQLLVEVHNSANKSYCYKRLNILEEKFRMHLLFNQEKEILEQKCNQQRDFYNVRKVDTHVHHSACMNVNLLLDFIKQKVKEEPQRAVLLDAKTGKTSTLLEVFQRHHLNPQAINVGVLDMQAGLETFHRFDRFNKKYNPFSQTDFREIFLKTDNLIGGEYLAEITKRVFHNYSVSKYQFSELRISIYGKSPKEWDRLAEWFHKHEVYHHQARWMIQIPRIYEIYKKAGVVENFQQMIDNIFKILFDVTINPEHNPKLYKLLLQVVGFDSVDDESLYEKSAHAINFRVPPQEWNYSENPHYCYWAYYLWANISSLNHLRKERGLNSFSFRPHCGEAGSAEHLIAAYLLADGINHGIKLEKAPVLEYLFYLKKIGIAMSPLSNNKLFLRYQHNPLPKFFARGLNVSLSTDDPLIFHMTNEPLMEEYSIAAQVYAFSSCDVCEIARNSVLQSGFEEVVKKYWLGKSVSLDKNCFEMSNVPNTRFNYRQDTLKAELDELNSTAIIDRKHYRVS